jgi:hypothetical protein
MVGGARAGERDLDGEPSFGPGTDRQGAFVGADDRLDDRQREPRARSMARALGCKPLERLGEPADRTGVDDGPVLVTDRSATPPRRPVVTSIRPGFELYASALSARFAMRRSARRGSPAR